MNQRQLDQALMEAVKRNDILSVDDLISKGADVNAQHEGNTIFLYAAMNNNLPLIKHILENKKVTANLDIADDYGYTPLLYAAWNNNFQLVIDLIEYGMSKETINKANRFNNTALLWACKHRNKEMVELLLQNGGNSTTLNLLDSEGYSPFARAVALHDLELAKYLYKHGTTIETVNKPNVAGYNALTLAASNGKTNLVKYLIEIGAKPIDNADETRDPEIKKLLIAHKYIEDISNYKSAPTSDCSLGSFKEFAELAVTVLNNKLKNAHEQTIIQHINNLKANWKNKALEDDLYHYIVKNCPQIHNYSQDKVNFYYKVILAKDAYLSNLPNDILVYMTSFLSPTETIYRNNYHALMEEQDLQAAKLEGSSIGKMEIDYLGNLDEITPN
ncbi:MAG: ankyrin repeat protein [Rickettsiaceae bacterium]|jgi:ankyrin repeat protein|nr:ankyrin repeat protein [Rickettsiaceae bacterium]